LKPHVDYDNLQQSGLNILVKKSSDDFIKIGTDQTRPPVT